MQTPHHPSPAPFLGKASRKPWHSRLFSSLRTGLTQLPGAIASVAFLLAAAGQASGQATLELATTTTGLTRAISLTKPVGVRAGDLLLATVAVEGDPASVTVSPSPAPPASPTPTDWRLARREPQGTNMFLAIYYKTATLADESAVSYPFTLNNDKKWSAGLMHIKGQDLTTPIVAQSGSSSATASTSLTAPTVTTTAANQLVLAVYMVKKSVNITTTVTGMTRKYQAQADPPTHALFSYTQASAGATGSKAATSSISETFLGVQLVLGTAPPPSLTTTTITASPTSILANGSTTSTITVQLKDASNNTTTSSSAVTLATTRGTLSAVTYAGNGSYTATLTSSIASGTATITGKIGSGDITGNAQVTFTPGAASIATSTVTASPTSILANGVSTSTITVQLKDTNGNNTTSSDPVTLSTTSGNLGTVSNVGGGSYTATLTSATISATATITGKLNGVTITDDAQVAFTPGAASIATSTVTASPTSIVANGVSTSTITVQLKDANGNNTTSSDPVTLSTTSGSLGIVSNVGGGSYTATLTSPTATGTATITGKLNGVNITGSAQVAFTGLCPDTWEAWQDEHLAGPDSSGLFDNPDGDLYNNLLEYAFCMSPEKGEASPFKLVLDGGKIHGEFRRTAGSTQDLVYILEYTAALGIPTQWTRIILNPSNSQAIQDKGIEIVVIEDLEGLTGLTAGTGFVRLVAALAWDEAATEVSGWTRTTLGTQARTLGNPYVSPELVSGTVASFEALEIEGLDGPITLPQTSGAAYYVEITSGPLEGQRFDVAQSSVSLILASDNDANFNTASVNQNLTGAQFVVRQHNTLDSLFAPGDFVGASDAEQATNIQRLINGQWTGYWLYDGGASGLKWVTYDDMSDQGGTIIPPGEAVFIQNPPDQHSLVSLGVVRSNRFVQPLSAGFSLVGAGYPGTATPASRSLLLQAFTGTLNFKTADQFLLWKPAGGFETYYLLNKVTAPSRRTWVKVGDAGLADQNNQLLFPSDRGTFLNLNGGVPEYSVPAPWAASEDTD
jgi:hypothetical protein